jgi:inosine-uridine nucleoside N-ribohydrolase
MSTSPSLVILDTDPGVDDALALLYLHSRSDLRLLAITTVFGNADIETTTRNALWLRARLGLSVPVYRGAAAPLSGARGPSPVHVCMARMAWAISILATSNRRPPTQAAPTSGSSSWSERIRASCRWSPSAR